MGRLARMQFTIDLKDGPILIIGPWSHRQKITTHETEVDSIQNAVQDTEPNLWFARQPL